VIRWRRAERDDVAVIVALIAEASVGLTGPLPDLAACHAAFDTVAADPATEIVVGTRDGAVIATYQITILHTLSLAATTRAMLEDVRVRADLRGQGIGAQLLEDATARAEAAGATLMQFASNASRRDAHRFYARHGFVASHVGFKKPLGGPGRR